MQTTTILGISLGTSRTGVCVLKQGGLVEWQTHTFTGTWSASKRNDIISQFAHYVIRYAVKAIVVKIPPLWQLSPGIRQLLDDLHVLARQHGCQYDLYTKREMKCVAHLANTNSLIEYIVMEYPVLRTEYQKGIQGKQIYYQKLYEAVLVAHLYRERRLSLVRNRI